jgi:hypothetical protein
MYRYRQRRVRHETLAHHPWLSRRRRESVRLATKMEKTIRRIDRHHQSSGDACGRSGAARRALGEMRRAASSGERGAVCVARANERVRPSRRERVARDERDHPSG